MNSDTDSHDKDKNQTTQSTRLLALVGIDVDLFHTKELESFATVKVNGHRETWPIRSKDFKNWILREFYRVEKKAPSSQALTDTLATLEARARFEGQKRDVHVRVANHEGTMYIDLSNPAWEVVRLTPTGWSVEKDAPVRFRRTRSMAPHLSPERGGSLDELRPFLNLARAEDWTLVTAFLVACLRENGPFPILVLQGEQGSAKSTTARVLRSLIDPSTASLRSMPRDEHTLVIMAKNSWILSFDNLSGITPAMSDALCRISTGGGLSTRELYTDSDEVIFDAQRPVIVNGIDELIGRDDLKDRIITLCLPTIAPDQRRDEHGFWRQFETARPKILAALLDALCGALDRLPDIDLQDLPRMADFALLGTAVEQALGWPAGAFMAAYGENRADAAEQSIENDPVAQALLDMIPVDGMKQGTATELLKEMNGHVEDDVKRSQAWPKGSQALSSRLRRLGPPLRSVGVEIRWNRLGHARSRLVTIERKTIVSSSASAASASTKVGSGLADDADAWGNLSIPSQDP